METLGERLGRGGSPQFNKPRPPFSGGLPELEDTMIYFLISDCGSIELDSEE